MFKNFYLKDSRCIYIRVPWLSHMRYWYMMFARYFCFGGQRSFRVHFRFSVENFQEFLFPQFGIVEFFGLNWNNAFSSSICVFFFIQIEGHLGGQKVKFVFQMAKKIKYFKLKLNVSTCSTNVHGQRSKSVHSDVFIWPTIKGSKVKEGQIRMYFKLQK